MTNPSAPHVVPYPEAQAAYLLAWPVPYRLTSQAEAFLAGNGTAAEAAPEPDSRSEPEAQA